MTTDLRCPINPSRLLARVNHPTIVEGNLIEIACDHCKDYARRGDPSVVRVLHRYNVLGEKIETEIVRGP